MNTHPLPHQWHGAPSFRPPHYERRVWIKWALWTALVIAPVGAFLGLLGAETEADIPLAALVGAWVFVAPWSAIYFERTNTRYRWALDPSVGPQAPGFGLAVWALVLGCLFLGPIALVLAYFAWKRIGATDTPYARGAATAAVATTSGAITTIGFLLTLVGGLGGL